MTAGGGELSGARVLVTGGAGFIGSNLARAFAGRGARVRVLDDLSTGHLRNLEGVDCELLRGDVRDGAAVAEAVRGVDFVLHHAAIASVAEGTRDPDTSFAVNAGGTLKVLEAAARAGVRRVIFASSASVYGQGGPEPIAEDQPIQPCSVYAATKASGEALCRAFSASMGVEAVCLRYFNIFGPRQDPRSHYAGVIPVFIDALRRGAPVEVFGDGLQTRDFSFVGDVVDANLRACLTPAISGRSFNIGHGDSLSILDLARRLSQLMGAPLDLRHGPTRVGDVRHSRSDISLARAVLGFEPSQSFDDGLAETIRWFEERHGAAAPAPIDPGPGLR